MTPPIAWLTDDLVELLAVAICFGEFAAPELRKDTPHEYWGRVAERPKADYRRTARMLIAAVSRGERLMPKRPSDHSLAAYMSMMRLGDQRNARKHFEAMFRALPTLWEASALEARRVETPQAAPSRSDDIATAEGRDAPKVLR